MTRSGNLVQHNSTDLQMEKCEGWLAKRKQRGKKVLKPDRRYFVLKEGELVWYARYSDYKTNLPIKSIILRQFQVTRDGTTLFLTPLNAIERAKDKLRAYELRAETEEDAVRWYNHLLPGTLDASGYSHRPSFWKEVKETASFESTSSKAIPPSSEIHLPGPLVGFSPQPARKPIRSPPQATDTSSLTPSSLTPRISLERWEETDQHTLLANLRGASARLPASLPKWDTDDLQNLLEVLDKATEWFSSGAQASPLLVIDLGCRAFEIVQASFSARERMDGRLVFFASLYAEFITVNSKLFEDHLVRWCQEFTEVRQVEAQDTHEKLEKLAERIHDAEVEILQSEPVVHFRSLLHITLTHLLNQVGRFSKADEEFVRAYLGWIMDEEGYQTLKTHSIQQVENLDMFLAQAESQIQALQPDLIKIHNSISMENWTSQQRLFPELYGMLCHSTSGRPESKERLEIALQQTILPTEILEMLDAASTESGKWQPDRAYCKLLEILANSISLTLESTLRAALGENQSAGQFTFNISHRTFEDVQESEARWYAGSGLAQGNVAPWSQWVMDWLDCEIGCPSITRLRTAVDQITAAFPVVLALNSFDIDPDSITTQIESLSSPHVPLPRPHPNELHLYVVVTQGRQHSNRQIIARLRLVVSDWVQSKHQLPLFRAIAASTSREDLARQFAELPASETGPNMSLSLIQKNTAVVMQVWTRRWSSGRNSFKHSSMRSSGTASPSLPRRVLERLGSDASAIQSPSLPPKVARQLPLPRTLE